MNYILLLVGTGVLLGIHTGQTQGINSIVRPTREETGPPNTLPDCSNKKMDVFFILDSSTSIWVVYYRQMLQFVSHVITLLDVSPDVTRVGALTFSDDFQLGFDLDTFSRKEDAAASITEAMLPYKTGLTNTHLAIRYVRNDVSFRQDVTKVIVVITDGDSWSKGLTTREADRARRAGFHMVVVGVGHYRDEDQWKEIASDPDSDYIFNITDFTLLDSLREALPDRICTMPPIIADGDCSLTENADVLFLAGPSGTRTAFDVIASLARNFRSRDHLRVRYVIDACGDDVDRGFQGTESYCDRPGDLFTENDKTYVSLLRELRDAATNLRTVRNANQVAVLFIDDQSISNNRSDILHEVHKAAQSDGIEIIVMDLGVSVDGNFIDEMTQKKENVISYRGHSASRSVQQLLNRICESANFSFGEVEPV